MFNKKNRIRLFWWNEVKLQGKQKENYGDLLGRYLVEKISKKKVVWVSPAKFSIWNWFYPIYVTIGSVLTNVNKYCVVWGSGIISEQYPIKKAKFLAVRGPKTRNYLLNLGYKVPEIYGDPALLLPNYFNPNVSKKYKYGIVPHYNDLKVINNWFSDREDICIIDMMTNDIETKTDEFLRCEKIISSSLHGIIIAHAYRIPAIWQKFSNNVFGDDIKYKDYMESVKIKSYQPKIKEQQYSDSELKELFKQLPSLPLKKDIEELKKGLLKVCPFTTNYNCR
ncbi:exosortase [Lutibacter profundi]|uniref:Exosortase n=1 Tax=Lutibacter profundi TaxID=1622118 RepID=A0A0X8G4Z3_9FLAO|nr:polysaccharide pyruvyl transferase family protein [Lutibacter profundi]AMC10146.1 exosortase [Lutibacter profundi]